MLLVLFAGCDRSHEPAVDVGALTGGDPGRGRVTFQKYGCGTCHSIPGVPGASALVGPPLDRLGARMYIAGKLPNTPSNLLKWMQHPQEVVPGNVMPDMGVTDRDGRDMAAYLYTLR